MKPRQIKSQFEENRLSLIFASLFFVFYAFLPKYRVGDGSEYILQYLSLTRHAVPWISPAALSDYSNFITQNSIQGLVPGDTLVNWFSDLSVGDTFDFPHFWFYSFLAALVFTFFFVVNISLPLTLSFQILHAVLFFVILRAANKFHGFYGQLAILSLYFLSPLLWYGNKIHTEFFTFILVGLSSIYVYNQKFLAAFVTLSIASTQNISFSIIGLLVLAYFLSSNRRDISVILKHKLTILIGFSIALLHPAYFLLRHSVVTPQLITGGVNRDFSYKNYYIWIFDPDVGLLPNWPLGILFICYLLFNVVVKKSFNKKYLLFCFLFTIISLYAQNATTNLNSGATPGPARYGLWYVGLFFPLMLSLIKTMKTLNSTSLLSVLLVFLMVSSLWSYTPRRLENYLTPSITSKIIQTYIPELYSPSPEIFRERFSDFGEGVIPYIVVGPSCTKLLVTKHGDKNAVYAPKDCKFSTESLITFVNKRKSTITDEEYIHFQKGSI